MIPNMQAQTTGASDRQKVIGALLLAFTVNTVGRMEGVKKPRQFFATVLTQNLPAWVFILAILTIASDFDSTRDIAIAFALLFLVAAILTNGLDAMAVIQSLIDKANKRNDAKPSNTGALA